MLEGTLLNFDYTWKVSRDEYGYAQITITHEGKVTTPLTAYLEEYGDDPLRHRFLLPDGASDEAVTITVNAMREAIIAVSRKWQRRAPWPDAPNPSLPIELAPFAVYWGKIGAALNPDVAARLEASGVVRRLPAPQHTMGCLNPYVFRVHWAHHVTETGRFLSLYEDYAGAQARASLTAWMDWAPQWEGWLEEAERHAEPVPGTPSVFDESW